MKAEHPKMSCLLQDIQIPTWKWKDVNVDFVVGLPQSLKQYDSISVVVDRLKNMLSLFPLSLFMRRNIMQESILKR